MHRPQCHCADPAQQALPGDGQLAEVATFDGQAPIPPPAWVQAEHASSASPVSALLSGVWPDVELQPIAELPMKIVATSIAVDRMRMRRATGGPAPPPRATSGCLAFHLAAIGAHRP